LSRQCFSLAPLPAEIVKLLIQQVPDVPDFEVNLLSDGHFLKMRTSRDQEIKNSGFNFINQSIFFKMLPAVSTIKSFAIVFKDRSCASLSKEETQSDTTTG
jgi:hypothetical protein